VLACADDLNVLSETDEIDNCVASESSVLVALPDLVMAEISDPPSAIAPGKKFEVSDRVANHGTAPAGQTVTRYYFSFDGSRNSGDVLLIGNRKIPALISGDSNAGSRAATVPLSIPSGTYNLLACADDLGKAAESNEENNCRASASTVGVATP
jgi:subtilase family serine protease